MLPTAEPRGLLGRPDHRHSLRGFDDHGGTWEHGPCDERLSGEDGDDRRGMPGTPQELPATAGVL